MLGYLRRLQVIAPLQPALAVTPREILLAEYRHYLDDERGLSAGPVTHYLRFARVFLGCLPDPATAATRSLSAGQVTAYVLAWAGARRGKAPDMVTLPALRSLLRFLHVAGYTPQLLAAAVPAGRGRPRHDGFPRAASGDHIRAVLSGRDRDSAGGCRDYAILLTMARLALRGGEVARLALADIDWRAGELNVRDKGGRTDVQTRLGLNYRPRSDPGGHSLLIGRSRAGELLLPTCWTVQSASLPTLVKRLGHASRMGETVSAAS